jgi:aminocarboxymuconate-semialdehyde decarboxylase
VTTNDRAATGGGPVIDLHCHRESRAVMERMHGEAERMGRVSLQVGSELTKKVGREQLAALKPKMDSIDERLADMDAMGVDIQAVSLAPYQMYYWADPELGRGVSREMNDEMAEAISSHPDRFVGLGTVPLQDATAAVEELDHCIDDLGFKGLQIATHVDGEELSSPRLAPFWAAVEDRDVVVVIHSAGHTNPDRLSTHYFINIIGHPIEGTLAASHLIFGGVMERHPRLKIVLVHGGGYLPAYSARMDHAYHAREDVREGLPNQPSDYLRRFYLDTMVFAPDQLRYLVDKYGADHVVLGTDYPYDMGENDPVGLIGATGIDDGSRSAICGGNAARLLGIS